MNSRKVIAIIGAMEAEIECLKKQLEHLQTHYFGKKFVVYTGRIGGADIALSLSGIGKVNAAIATTLVLEHFSPDYVINTGSAGGIGPSLRVGDVVIGVEVAHHDVDVTPFGYVHGQVPQMPARFTADSDLVEAAAYSAKAFNNARVVQGLIVSGDCFIHSEVYRRHIVRHFPDVQAVEMEAAAIAQTCHQFEKPFVIIRAISDSAQEEAKVSFDEFLQTAAQHSAQMVLNLIKIFA
ncbi:5'-methylthioadenosine/adenosylhomocysteine nucleosidase [Neisseriaceae bacterium B1]